MNPYINKFLVALVTVLGAISVMINDGISAQDVIAMVILALNAFGVYQIENGPLSK